MRIRWGKIGWYLLLACGLSWALAGGYYALGGRLGSPWATLVLLPYMFGPLGAALIVQKGICKQPVVRPLGITFPLNGWWFVAWLLPIVLAAGAFGIALLFPGVSFAPDLSGMFARYADRLSPEQVELMRRQLTMIPPLLLLLITLGSSLLAGPTINAVAAFGEELGWRGFLQRELAPLGFWGSSLVIGIVWGLWHAPLIIQGYNYPQHPLLGVGMMTVTTVLLAIIFTYVRVRGGSVLQAAVLHGSFNATAGLSLLYLKGGDDLLVGPTGLSGLLALALVIIGLYLYDRTRKTPIMRRGPLYVPPPEEPPTSHTATATGPEKLA